MGDRPVVGVKTGRWYCDPCQHMANTPSDDAEALLAEHLAGESHTWRVNRD